VSRCLGFANCRYDGAIVACDLVERLKPFVEFIPICPEVAIGLGVPRDPIRVLRTRSGLRLFQPSSGLDLTVRMRDWANEFLRSLPEIHGFLLKSRSPSCALRDAKHYLRPDSEVPLGRGPGLFGASVLERFRQLPAEDEMRLADPRRREHFLTRIFCLARFSEVKAAGQARALLDFHTRHKLLFVAYNQRVFQRMERVVARMNPSGGAEWLAEYEALVLAALARPPRLRSVANALTQAFCYFSRSLEKAEQELFLSMIALFREGQLPVSAPLSLLRGWAFRFGEARMAGQAFFAPYPEALRELQVHGTREKGECPRRRSPLSRR
jgi:uncharacterized protein YbgA (DUF1722 family)/uncharacterized protein YbbK (DUF523 family)